MKDGDVHVFANLFYVDESPDPIYRLRELRDVGYLIAGERERWIVRAGKQGRWDVEPARDRAPPPKTEEAPPAAPTPDLTPQWQDEESARILSSAVMTVKGAARYAVGLADGRIRVRDEDGR